MSFATRIDELISKNHEPAALAIDERAIGGGALNSLEKPGIAGERCGVKLRISARQVDGIGIR
jgi:hypothetical protein